MPGSVPVEEPDPVVFGRSKVVEPPEPVPLRPSSWAKQSYAAAAVLAGPVYFVSSVGSGAPGEAGDAASLVALASGLVVFASVVAWTWINVDNCRRLLAHSRYRDSISPWRAVFWWAAPAVVGGPLTVALVVVDRRWIDPRGVGGDADIVRGFLVAGLVLVLLVLWARPYLYLGAVMKRIHGEPSLFHRWLWVPLIVTVLAGSGVVAARLSTLNDDASQIAPQATAILVFAALPYIVWFWTGWRALSIMDELVHARSVRQYERRAHFLTTEIEQPEPLDRA